MELKKNIAISESGFVFNASRGESFNVNPIGHYILELIKEGKHKTEIIELILEAYQIDMATCEKDVDDFIKMLNQNNIVE